MSEWKVYYIYMHKTYNRKKERKKERKSRISLTENENDIERQKWKGQKLLKIKALWLKL